LIYKTQIPDNNLRPELPLACLEEVELFDKKYMEEKKNVKDKQGEYYENIHLYTTCALEYTHDLAGANRCRLLFTFTNGKWFGIPFG
jgi:hypothetical protein